MMVFIVMGVIPVVAEAALFTQVIPARIPSATPVRKQPTRVLIPQAHCVLMTAISVPMISVTGREYVDIPTTPTPAMIPSPVLKVTPARVVRVTAHQIIPSVLMAIAVLMTSAR
jgi:hypothetical protein